MRRDLFLPTPEGEGRLLLLIDMFTTPTRSLEGRTKLAKLDFLVRYPGYFRRAIALRAPELEVAGSGVSKRVFAGVAPQTRVHGRTPCVKHMS